MCVYDVEVSCAQIALRVHITGALVTIVILFTYVNDFCFCFVCVCVFCFLFWRREKIVLGLQ